MTLPRSDKGLTTKLWPKSLMMILGAFILSRHFLLIHLKKENFWSFLIKGLTNLSQNLKI